MTAPTTPARRLEQAIRTAPAKPALVAYLTGDYPTPARFAELLPAVAAAADAVEIGIPFSDPMADGATIQRASRAALAGGTTLRGLIELLRDRRPAGDTPVVLMGYLNPFLRYGLERLAHDAFSAGVAGFIVPDLPHEEAGPFRAACSDFALALVPLVSPVTPPERLRAVVAPARGFVYAVTVTGVTGGAATPDAAKLAYLDAVRAAAPVPVCAGFGVRTPADVAALAPHCDGVIVGSALIEAIDRGDAPADFLRALRGTVDSRQSRVETRAGPAPPQLSTLNSQPRGGPR